ALPIFGHALVDDLGDAVGERTVDLVGMGGDPGQVGGAPVHVVAPAVRVGVREEERVAPGGLGEVAAGGVHQALGLAGGAGGVHDEQRCFGLERLGVVRARLRLDGLVPPQVPAL